LLLNNKKTHSCERVLSPESFDRSSWGGGQNILGCSQMLSDMKGFDLANSIDTIPSPVDMDGHNENSSPISVTTI
jgi:hypothetical protein